jgi:two-component system phosphate regulon response regulator OmpR
MMDMRLGWSELASRAPDAPHVLVVDDEARIRRAFARLLGDFGYRYRMAASAEEAKSWLSALDFDVGLLDIQLPRMSGIEFLVWALDRYPELPIIMLTALEELDVAVECLQTGARSYLLKPIQPGFLKLAIDDAMVLGHLLADRNDLAAGGQTVLSEASA